MPKQAHHYYATTCYGWAVADTREQALKSAAGYAGADIIKRAVKAQGGLTVTVCRVELPQAAHYSINEYLPEFITKEDGVNEARKGERVPLSEIENLYLVNSKGKTIPKP